ncbi:MAG TPA: ORF6N domain-containing protein [Pyrinomonadaceae bacterium]|nr:ORF6N domain-containing protein [Pyrinomonadaceae bacterium]
MKDGAEKRFVVLCKVEVRSTRSQRTQTTHELISVPAKSVEQSILVVRSQKVILDRTLARFYGVSTKVLNQAVKRNPDRFPPDFMFQLTMEEARALQVKDSRSQIVTLKQARGKNLKYRPYAFTEHGILMLSSVLRSERAVKVNIQIMRTFVRLREMLPTTARLSKRLTALELKYERRFKVVFDEIRRLVTPPAKNRNPIGFRAKTPKK